MIFKTNGDKLSLSLFGLTDKISSFKTEINGAKQAVENYNKYVSSLGNPNKSAYFLKNLQNTTDTFKDYTKTLNGAQATFGGYIRHLVSTKAKTVALNIATKALKMALESIIIWGISAAFSAISKSIQEAKQAQEDFRQSQIEAGKTADETNDKLQEYIATYHQLAKTGGSADQLKDLQQQIADLVGVQADNLDLVNGKLDDELEKLKQISIEQAQKNKGDLTGALVSAEQDLEAAKGSGAYSGYSHRFFKIDDSLLNNTGFMSLLDSLGVAQRYSNTGEFTGSFTFAQDGAENLYKSYQAAVQAVAYLKSNVDKKLWENSALYDDLSTQIGKYSEAAKAYGDALDAFNQNEAIIAVGENLKTFTGEINNQTSFDNWVNGIIDAEGATGDYADAIWEVCGSRYPQFARESDKVANELNKVEEAAEGAASSVKTLITSLSELEIISDKFSKLGSAISELKDNGYVSIKTINEIAEAFKGTEGLDDYISKIATASNTSELQGAIKGLVQSYLNQDEVLKDLDGTNKAVLVTQLKRLGVTNAEVVINDKLYQTYSSLIPKLENVKNLTAAEAESLLIIAQSYNLTNQELNKYNQLLVKRTKIEQLKKRIENNDGRDDKFLTKWLKDIDKLEAESQAIANAIDTSSLADRYSGEVDIKINTSGLEDLSTGKSAEDKHKEEVEEHKKEAEAEIAKLKYKLETNKITEEQYLKDLDSAYKSFYNKTADYLEDYAKYSQEVYDGFKDMYKEDLEAQKESWEEKKDAVSEYYDNLREQIEDAHDEEDYEKEQSEKRKKIFDIDMQIAELMKDGSERAKARIAELEEDRKNAEEELLDFETDKARDDEMSRLEKEQEAEEKKIQSQIDAIDEELQKIDGDIVDGLYNVRKTIVDYAAKQGVTLDFAYASGTRSSVGGFGRINEKGIEMISAPDGNGNYVNLMPNSYVFSAKATEFLWKLATEHSLPQAMYNSIAKSIKTQSSTPSVNIAQPINITMGDIIIEGNADKQTVADIKKQQENTVRMVLQKIKELQK